MKSLFRFILALVFVASCATVAPAQWNLVQTNDQVIRPFTSVPVLMTAAIPTSSTITSLDTIVNNYSIAGGNAIGVIPSNSVGTITTAKTLALLVVDADSGGEIRGTITIRGNNQFGQINTAVVSITSAGGRAASTLAGFVGKPTITLNLTGTEASDLLHVGEYGYALSGVNVTTLTNVIWVDVSNSSAVAAASGTWNSTWQTYLPSSAVGAGDTLYFSGYSDRQTNPFNGQQNITGSTAF